MLHQNSRDLFDELMEKLAEKEFKNRGFVGGLSGASMVFYDKILDEMYEKFELLELKIIEIETDAAFNKPRLGDK